MDRPLNHGRPSGPLRDLAPLLGPLAVVESVRTRAVPPVVFAHAKVVHIMAGRTRVTTAGGMRELSAGDAMVLGAGVWCAAVPSPRVRAWTIYLDESYLRHHMAWALPDHVPLAQGVPLSEWDGSAIFLCPGMEALERLEPLLRQMSMIPSDGNPQAVAELMTLFARAVEIAVPTLIAEPDPAMFLAHRDCRVGPLTTPAPGGQVVEALQLLRGDLARSWTVAELAGAVALSASQLTRLFARHLGATPMRLLTELRVTEFARLIEETTLTVEAAARRVGWGDRRVAASWFNRRYGISPTEFRRQPAPVCTGEQPCALCQGQCLLTAPA